MFYYENITAGNSSNSKKIIGGTSIAELATYIIVKHTQACELRECSFNGKFTCFEIYLEGEFLIKTDDKRKALSLFRDFSAA